MKSCTKKLSIKNNCVLVKSIRSLFATFVYKCFKTKNKLKVGKTIDLFMNCIGILCLLFSVTTKENKYLYNECAVSSELPEASNIGLKILQKGGNSVDAAVSTCLAVGIVNSFSSGLGGGGFILIKQKGKQHKPVMIDFRETTPESFDIKKIIEHRERSKVGGMSVGIPCEISGLFFAHKKYGRLPWSELFDEVIELCKSFRVSKELARRLKKFEREIRNDEGLRNTYVKNGVLVKEGDIISRTNFLETLKLLKESKNELNDKEIINSLISFINRKGGSVTDNDFAISKPRYREVLVDKYKKYDVYTTSLPSSGILVIEALKILEKLDLNKIYEESKRNHKFTHIHLLVEICKFVMAKRGELGDPKFIKDPVKVINKIRSPENILKIFSKINISNILKEEDYGTNKYNVVDHGTTHINVLDKEGLVVSLTSTINLEFGAKIMDPKTGIILNNQIDDFYFPEKYENIVNVSSVPNLARPKQIPLSSVAPIILEKENEILVLGAAGGIRIPTSIIGVIFWLNLGLDLDQSINQPRLHHQSQPNVVYVEHTEDKNVVKFLRSLGHVVEVSETNSIFTSVQGILAKFDKNRTIIQAVSDKRKGGKPAGI